GPASRKATKQVVSNIATSSKQVPAELEVETEVVAEELIISEEEVLVSLLDIEDKWQHVIEKMTKANQSMSALLKAARVVGIEGKFLKLDVYYAFHKERLESVKNRK